MPSENDPLLYPPVMSNSNNNDDDNVWVVGKGGDDDTPAATVLTPAFHKQAYRIFDTNDEQVIRQALVKYTETVELIHARCPTMRYEIADWALAMALSPEWYAGALTDRLQNSMLVSALMLTVTAELFYDPPLDDENSPTYRVLVYLAGICNVCFLLSIMVGVFFIENAMSRSYCQSERFILIMKYYTVKDASQVLMCMGSFLFPVVIAVPIWEKYRLLDAYLLTVVTGLYVLLTVGVVIWTTMGATAEQERRLALFRPLIDPTTSRLHTRYYPPDAVMQPQDFAEMYAP